MQAGLISVYRHNLTPRELFTIAGRRLNVYFYTSNIAKFLQANLVFQRAGLPLRQFVSRTAPYFEDYGGSSENLLEKAVAEVTSHVGHASLIFVEDTTVRIEALSSSDGDVPGLGTKEWFENTSFGHLDRELSALGRGRECVVKSDIALHVPLLAKPIFVHGETAGIVASTAPQFKASALYPWLTPDTFNGWFIPSGAAQRLGEMELEESLAFDFRIRSFVRLLDRLEELSAALNLPPPAYTRQQGPVAISPLSLFPRPIYVFVGPTCAGKTTAATFLEGTRGWSMIEASNIMRELGARHGFDVYSPIEMARRVVAEQGKAAVANEILARLRPDVEYVISGLRFVEELEALRLSLPGRVRLVVINAPQNVRLARMLDRQRPGDTATSLDDLSMRDAEQEEFGLIPFARKFSDEAIENVGTKDDLYRRLDSIVHDQPSNMQISVTFSDSLDSDQALRCLKVLARERRPMSTDEISSLTGEYGRPIRHNNVNKVLKRLTGLVHRIEEPGERVRYEILPAGFAYVQFADGARR